MKLDKILKEHRVGLMQAAVQEALSRTPGVSLHPLLGAAALIYDPVQKQIMAQRYHNYIAIACEAQLPILVQTPSWRANQQRVSDAGIDQNINADTVDFLHEICKAFGGFKDKILIAGDMGCKNDPYRPGEALSQEASKRFHTWQIDQLCGSRIDLLTAGPLPAVSEALGIALAMQGRQLPYVINFILNPEGCLLDASPLEQAVKRIDDAVATPPAGYMIGCSYPSFLHPEKICPSVLSRIIGYMANASSLDYSKLDDAKGNLADDITDWGTRMIALNRQSGITLLGGCCGTRQAHLKFIVDKM